MMTVFRLLLLGFFLQIILVTFEYFVGEPILSGIVAIKVSTVGSDVLLALERGGAYRAKGFFDNPLSLAEYTLYCYAFILGFRLFKPRKQRYLYVFLALLAILAIYFTGSRYPLLALTASSAALWFFYTGFRLPAVIRPIFTILAISLSFLGAVLAYFAITNIQWTLATFSPILGDDVSSIASIVSRAAQYQMVSAEILSNATNGVLGSGLRSDTIERLGVRLDNYYLRALIEGGFLGLISYILMLIVPLKEALKLRTFSSFDLPTARALRLVFGLFFMLFMANKFFLSMSFNNHYFFLFVGILIALTSSPRRAPINEADKHAHPPST